MKKTVKYFDYCHNPYVPLFSGKGRISSDQLLYNSLLQNPYAEQFLAIFKKIKDTAGPWNTVWGVKLDKGHMFWEVYFYNHRVKDSPVAVAKILKGLSSHFNVPKFSEEEVVRWPYFMFSFDVNEKVLKTESIEGIHLYVPGRMDASQGSDYYWNGREFLFGNHYDFFKVPQDIDKFFHRVKHSIVLSKDFPAFFKNDLVKVLMPCHEVCFANKRDRDGVYFSRVNIEQFLYFLDWFSYPLFIRDYIRSKRKKLDHLLYDVAFDCALSSGKVVFGKSSYYGGF